MKLATTPVPGIEIPWACDACGEVIRDHGYLHVEPTDAMAYLAAHAQSGAQSTTGIASPPFRAKWKAHHESCHSDPAYWVEIGRVQTFAGLVDVTAELMEKTWLPGSTWRSELLVAVGA